jgi:DNA-binding NtrC family response regulator
MDRIILYHQGFPVTYHALDKDTLSIGSHPENDMVLASEGVCERHLVIYRAGDGRWRARRVGKPAAEGTQLDCGAPVDVGAFRVAMETGLSAPGGFHSPSFPSVLGWVGASPALRILKQETMKLAPLRAPVLISGESGTGKELVAQALHDCGPRRNRPFVPVNCGGLTESLLEDTLFGHDPGAFTGATRRRQGVFEKADGGTVFLDEIGEMPIGQQAALLRVLDDYQVQRIGSDRSRAVGFRLVAATNRSLRSLVEKERFRLDLYHRISTLSLATTPLRDRMEDVPLLARHFCRDCAAELGMKELDDEAVSRLEDYHWPGNVRELRNVIYRSAALATQERLLAKNIAMPSPRRIRKPGLRLDKLEDYQLERFLDRHDGNVTAAARELGVPRTTLRDRLTRLL